jgi:hypothetical protein
MKCIPLSANTTTIHGKHWWKTGKNNVRKNVQCGKTVTQSDENTAVANALNLQYFGVL